MARNTLTPSEIEQLRKVQNLQRQQSELGIQQTNTSFESKTYETFLPIDGFPSRNKFYQNSINGQPLKVEDLLLIQSITSKNYHKIFNDIFSRRIRGVESYDILEADEVYFALWLRANSYPGYSFPHDGFDCENPECGAHVPANVVEFNFNDMEFNSDNLNDIYNMFGPSGIASITLKSGRKLDLSLRRRKHNARVQSILHRDFYSIGIEPPDDLVLLMNMAVLVKFPEVSDLMDTVNVIRNSFTSLEFSELHNKIKKYSISGDPVIKLQCPVCKEFVQFSGYTFRPEFFIPDID